MEKEKIVFFDGICNLCTSSVQFLLKYNRKQNLKFVALQSEYFVSRYPEDAKSIASILYLSQGILYRESTAILKISQELVFPLSLFSLFLFVPRIVRDFFYRIVAKRRYQIFGKRENCYLPTPELEKRFLN